MSCLRILASRIGGIISRRRMERELDVELRRISKWQWRTISAAA